MPVLQKRQRQIQPARMITLGFSAIVLLGATLLCMPFSSATGQFTNFVDSLFTATSATCVTGITIYDTFKHWSSFGHVVIILLIQVGGLGFLTLVTFFNLAIGKKLGWITVKNVAADFTENALEGTKRLFTEIVLYSFIIELFGAFILMTIFVPDFGVYGIFISVFMAISAFCNAGFDLMTIEPEAIGMSEYTDNPLVMLTLIGLIILGGLGFMVWENFRHFRTMRRLLLHTKVVLVTTAALLLIGTVIFFFAEFSNPKTMGSMPVGEKLLTSLFVSTSSRTAGFPCFDLTNMMPISKVVTTCLMFVGAAPASTGGGIKVTTLAIMLATVYSVIKNREETQIMGHRLKKGTVYKTLTVFVLSLVVVAVSFSIIFISNPDLNVSNTVFEVVSAFSTTGYSMGISTQINDLSKIVLVMTMLIGRVGPVTLMLSLMIKHKNDKDVVIPEGDILVG